MAAPPVVATFRRPCTVHCGNMLSMALLEYLITNFQYHFVDEFIIRTMCGFPSTANTATTAEQIVSLVESQSPQNGQNIHHPCEAEAEDVFFDGWGG